MASENENCEYVIGMYDDVDDVDRGMEWTIIIYHMKTCMSKHDTESGARRAPLL